MAKIRVEVCLISARGLRRSSSLWKLQWFAVGWIDPNNKYCTKIDASGSSNPTWKTKFSASMGDAESNLEGVTLHVEVYSREPIFLRESLYGTATILLKEFLAKYLKNNSSKPAGNEEVGSFQLRKKSSGKPLGFVDVSIRISEERDNGGGTSYSGFGEGSKLTGNSDGISLVLGNGPGQPYPSQSQYPAPLGPQMTSPYPMSSFPGNHSNPSAGGPSYRPSYNTPPPPPPPPPSHVGYLPTFLPRNDQLPGTYVNLPSSGAAPGHGGGPGFGMGVGAGALAAGAVIFGDDFMSGFELPSGLQDANLTISTDPLF